MKLGIWDLSLDNWAGNPLRTPGNGRNSEHGLLGRIVNENECRMSEDWTGWRPGDHAGGVMRVPVCGHKDLLQ